MAFCEDWQAFVEALPERRADAHPLRVSWWLFRRVVTPIVPPIFMKGRKRTLLYIATAVAVAVALYYSSPFFPTVITDLRTIKLLGDAEDPSAFIRNVSLMIGGLWALWLATTRTRVTQQGHITDRYSKAVEQLGHDSVAVRIGGLYALRRIAEDSPDHDHLAVMDVLTNFIRHPPYAKEQHEAAERDRAIRTFNKKSREKEPETTAPRAPEPIDCPDVAAATQIIQHRTARQQAVEAKRAYRFSLSRANLGYLQLAGADLHGLALDYANFTGAFLPDALLLDTDLTGAILEDTFLGGADLTGAILTRADLLDAFLMNANLNFANLAGARLNRVEFEDANLGGADLTGANLTDANLIGAKDLTQEQLDSAFRVLGLEPPTLDEGFNPPPTWAADA